MVNLISYFTESRYQFKHRSCKSKWFNMFLSKYIFIELNCDVSLSISFVISLINLAFVPNKVATANLASWSRCSGPVMVFQSFILNISISVLSSSVFRSSITSPIIAGANVVIVVIVGCSSGLGGTERVSTNGFLLKIKRNLQKLFPTRRVPLKPEATLTFQ